MKLNESQIYTVVNADKVMVGSKGYCSDTIKGLMMEVNNSLGNDYEEIQEIRDNRFASRFVIRNRRAFNLFYLVAEPEKFRPYWSTDEND